VDNCPDNRVIGISPELIMPRKKVQEKSWIVPSAAELFCMELCKEEDEK